MADKKNIVMSPLIDRTWIQFLDSNALEMILSYHCAWQYYHIK